MAASSEILPESWQVFINFRGADLSKSFINNLEGALTSAGIKYYIHTKEVAGEALTVLFRNIEQSEIALSIFSSNYAESEWCLDELVKIMEQVEKGKLRIIPVFFNVRPDEVREQKGEFGLKLYGDGKRKRPNIPSWENALQSVPSKIGLELKNFRNERDLVEKIVDSIKRVLALIPPASRVTEYPNEISQDSGAGNVDRFRANEFPCSSLDISVTNDDNGITPIQCPSTIDEVGRVGGGEHLNGSSTVSSTGIISSRHIEPSPTRLIGEGVAIDRIAVNLQKMPEYIPADGTENPIDTYTEFHTDKYEAKPEGSSSAAKLNADFLDRTFTNSRMDGKVKSPNIQVFINFRGEQLRNNFIGYLVDALQRSEINVFIDNQEQRGEDLNTLFKRIEDSGIAIVVFSSRYTESKWCLDELVKIKERVDKGMLKVLPIFYKVTPNNVKRLKGQFGDHFRDKEYMYKSDEPMIKQWKEAIVFVSQKFALTLDEKRY